MGHLRYLQVQAEGPRWGQVAGQGPPEAPQLPRCCQHAWSLERGWCEPGGRGWGRGAGVGSPGGREHLIASPGRHVPLHLPTHPHPVLSERLTWLKSSLVRPR